MGPVDEMRIGQKAIEEGILSPERVNWCLDLRSRVQKWGVSPPRIGEVAAEKGWISDRDLTALYGDPGRAGGSAAAPSARRSARARAAEAARRKAWRMTAFFLLLTVLFASAAAIIEFLLR